MKSELICPNCSGNLELNTDEYTIYLHCPNLECGYECDIDMNIIFE
ncbi:hypothetical protein ACIQXZ_12290 [Bacillus thuringiensis]